MAAKSKKKNRAVYSNKATKQENGKGIGEAAASSSSNANTISLIVAVLALLAGLRTPYIMNMYTNNKNNHDNPSSSSSSSSSSLTDDSPVEQVEQIYPAYTPCNSENLANWLHEQPVIGLHVLCFAYETTTTTTEAAHNHDDHNKLLHVKLYPNAVKQKYEEFTVPAAARMTTSTSYEALRESLSSRLNLNQKQHFRAGDEMNWQMYTTSGEWLNCNVAAGVENEKELQSVCVEALVKAGMVLIFEGGVFLWPGVRVGFERVVNVTSRIDVPASDLDRQNLFSDRDLMFLQHRGDDSKAKGSTRAVTLKTLSLVPLVLSVEHFLGNDECDHIQKRALPSMRNSGVSHNDQDKGSPASKWRTSSSTFLQLRPNEQILHEIDRRVASLTRVPRDHQEQAQVLRYTHLQKYNSHHDYFDNNLYRTSDTTQRLIQGGRRNRLATVFWYLSDIKEGGGGETIFPRVNYGPSPVDMADCSVGLKVRPEKGKVIIFYSLLMNGDLNPYSLHGACPVLDEQATKWAANKWIWNSPMHFVEK
eukprot:CAMPEP_0196801952 /NCGR_PEP_ID=MMETSP1362-20130617/1713_1 /TAXON_ID=163516 /ORGANISM="Leptocylindrus danicus, Strain CCMP1856" /LENGTH=532 /DNA_ID=CAMNT_0042173143 /DNA_START=47 /DNA_END=1645 /DNA_ORIENTATION=-